ncbi:OmpA family protein [Phocaeicola abscessus]|uniref:OmpA family protein n=1 Tax=Phocaeicola abscessus TaxID=555313 RepID=UPI00055E0375
MNIKQKKSMKNILLSLLTFTLLGLVSLSAQNTGGEESMANKQRKPKRAWEIGVGGTMINWDRISVTGFRSTPEQYLYHLKVKHLLGGANLYLARELNRWFYLDLQGTIGFAGKEEGTANEKDKNNYTLMGGLGLQFRLSPLFKSKYVEPYLRVGGNVLHKNFLTTGTGVFYNDPTGQAGWISDDVWNKRGYSHDKKTCFPVSLGAGVNAWLNNSVGVGLQGEYLTPFKKNLPRFAQITMRVIWRIGGHDKRPTPVVRYVEIEKPVDRIVEKIVEKEMLVPAETQLCELFNNVNFEFDKDVLTAESKTILEQAAQMLKTRSDARFLITGYTDARGSDAYNLDLSRRRAKVVVDELVKNGVPTEMLKSRGVGKRIAAMPASETNGARLGDRKTTIERVLQMEYWNKLP